MNRRLAFFAGVFLSLVLPSVLYFGTADNFLIKYFTLSAVFVIYIAVRRINTISLSNTAVFMFVYFLLGTLSLAWSANVYVSADILARTAFIAAAGYVIGASVSKEDRKVLAAAVSIGSILPVGYGFLQACGFDPFPWRQDFAGRIYSSLGNPNFFSGYLVALIPITAYFVYAEGKKARAAFGLLLISQVACLILTGTRSSVAAMIFQVFLMFFLMRKRKMRTGAVILLLFAASLLAVRGEYGRRFVSGFSLNSSSVRQRYFRWMTALDMFKERPLFGHGTGGVKTKFALYQAGVSKKYDIRIKGTSDSQIHSEYLQVLVQTGLAGLILFAAIMFSGLKDMLAQKSIFSLFALVSSSGVLLDSMASFPLYIVPTGFVFYLLIGMFSSEKAGMRVGYKSALMIKVLAAAVFIKTALPCFYADILRNRADNTAQISPMKAHDYYERANMIYPVNGQAEYRHAKLMMQHKKIDLALSALQNSAAIRHYGEVYNNIGIAYYLKNDREMALVNWKKALKIGLPEHKDEETLRKNIGILSRERKSDR